VLGALAFKDVIGRHALALQDVILDGSRCLERVSGLIADRGAISLRAGAGQHRVRTRARPRDHGIRRVIGVRQFSVKRTVGAVAFEP
jgi:hypothetical protein